MAAAGWRCHWLHPSHSIVQIANVSLQQQEANHRELTASIDLQ